MPVSVPLPVSIAPITLVQPIGFNGIRYACITFADSYLPLICQHRVEQIKLTFSQLQEWKKSAENLCSQPIFYYFYSSVVDLKKSIEDLENNLQFNKSFSCNDEWVAINAEQSKIAKEIEMLNELNEQIIHHIPDTHHLFPASSMVSKQLELMTLKVEQWELITNQFLEAPLNKTMPNDVQKIQSQITSLKRKITSIKELNQVSNYEIADMYFNAKRIQRQLDKLTKLNIGLKEYDSMLESLNPGKEVIFSCYNNLAQTLRIKKYPIPSGPQTYNREDECMRDNLENENRFASCTITHKIIPKLD